MSPFDNIIPASKNSINFNDNEAEIRGTSFAMSSLMDSYQVNIFGCFGGGSSTKTKERGGDYEKAPTPRSTSSGRTVEHKEDLSETAQPKNFSHQGSDSGHISTSTGSTPTVSRRSAEIETGPKPFDQLSAKEQEDWVMLWEVGKHMFSTVEARYHAYKGTISPLNMQLLNSLKNDSSYYMEKKAYAEDALRKKNLDTEPNRNNSYLNLTPLPLCQNLSTFAENFRSYKIHFYHAEPDLPLEITVQYAVRYSQYMALILTAVYKETNNRLEVEKALTNQTFARQHCISSKANYGHPSAISHSSTLMPQKKVESNSSLTQNDIKKAITSISSSLFSYIRHILNRTTAESEYSEIHRLSCSMTHAIELKQSNVFSRLAKSLEQASQAQYTISETRN